MKDRIYNVYDFWFRFWGKGKLKNNFKDRTDENDHVKGRRWTIDITKKLELKNIESSPLPSHPSAHYNRKDYYDRFY